MCFGIYFFINVKRLFVSSRKKYMMLLLKKLSPSSSSSSSRRECRCIAALIILIIIIIFFFFSGVLLISSVDSWPSSSSTAVRCKTTTTAAAAAAANLFSNLLPSSSSTSPYPSSSSSSYPSPLSSAASISIRKPLRLEDAYAGKMFSEYSAEIPTTGERFRTEFEPNRNAYGYGLSVVRNVCLLPEGPIALIGITQEELNATLAASKPLNNLWYNSYQSPSCGWCTIGSKLMDEIPKGSVWIKGNSVHVIPYMGNVFHNFAERIWPHVTALQYPLNETTMQSVDHIVVHKFRLWWKLAVDEGVHEKETLMLQFRILGEILGKATDFVAIDDQERAVCFERLTLDCSSCDRMTDLLGQEIISRSIISYREGAYRLLKMQEPQLSIPPRRLRVIFYGRSDTRRRRVMNGEKIVDHLRKWKNPPLEVVFVDEMLKNGSYNQTVAETVSLFSQADVLISVHGANTWGSMFMPRRSAVIEIYGPCGPGTWISGIVTALGLKHSTESNPWRDPVASPTAGNTTKCEGAYATPDFSLDLEKLDNTIRNLALPSAAGDKLTLFWLFDWVKKSY